jgi:hypothetical protein
LIFAVSEKLFVIADRQQVDETLSLFLRKQFSMRLRSFLSAKQIIVFIVTGLLMACNAKNSNPAPARNTPADTLHTQAPAPMPAVADTLAFSAVTAFSSNESQSAFTAPGGWNVRSFESGENLVVEKNKKAVGKIDIASKKYDGPGFSMYEYACPADSSRSVLLLEAQADPGTAWYCAALVENGSIKEQLFIDEPRSNSEIQAVSDFISVFYTRNQYIFRFNKKLVAGYSQTPPGMKEDMNYYYLLWNTN